MKFINEDIEKQEFKQAYLLFGPEDYLKKQYRDRLKKALAGDDTMNLQEFEGKGLHVGEIIDLAETLPFFADRRVIVIQNSGLFKEGGEALSEYLEKPSPSTFFIFVESEVDKRCKLYKSVKKLGRDTEFVTPDENMLAKWVLGILKRENKQVTQRALELFLQKSGTDMENISKELEKLICYCLEKDSIDVQDVEEIATKQISSHIFDMMEAIGLRQQKRALNLYYELLTLKVSPFQILALLGRQFNILLQLKELKGKGYPEKEMASKVGVPPFTIRKYLDQTSRFDRAELRQALSDCVQADEDIKTGRMDQQLAIELLIVGHSAKAKSN